LTEKVAGEIDQKFEEGFEVLHCGIVALLGLKRKTGRAESRGIRIALSSSRLYELLVSF